MRKTTDLRLSRFKLAAFLLLLAASPWAWGGDEQQASIAQLVAEMSRRIESITLAEANGQAVPRFNQAKTIGCVKAEFRIHAGLPEALRQGLFAEPTSYPAMLRFANASEPDDSKKDIRGLSIKLSKVKGEVLWGEAGKQDFLLNSYPALFVATPEEFLDFIRARQEDKKLRFFLNPFDPHLKSLWTLLKARQKHLSPLDIRYWSTVPFSLGEHQVVKYSVIPCSGHRTGKAVEAGENQLRAALKSHLRQGTGCFHFAVQLRTDPEDMPIEDASVIWSEESSPFQTLATITIEDQPLDTPEALAACERSSFNPWQSLAAHRPLGRMNEVRREVYVKAAELRNRE